MIKMTYNFCTSDFEGPLDLLLHLVKESKMDIYEINISEIINQYLDFIHSLEEKNIDIASEYLVMASELIHLKSKLLINRKDEEETSVDEFSFSSEEDLRNKLLEYEKYKQCMGEMEQSPVFLFFIFRAVFSCLLTKGVPSWYYLPGNAQYLY